MCTSCCESILFHLVSSHRTLQCSTNPIGVRGEMDLGGTGMLSRQDWVEIRGASAEGTTPTGVGSRGLPQTILKNWLPESGNEFSKHFRHFLVTLKEWVIPRKRRGELDSDPKMNQVLSMVSGHSKHRGQKS